MVHTSLVASEPPIARTSYALGPDERTSLLREARADLLQRRGVGRCRGRRDPRRQRQRRRRNGWARHAYDTVASSVVMSRRRSTPVESRMYRWWSALAYRRTCRRGGGRRGNLRDLGERAGGQRASQTAARQLQVACVGGRLRERRGPARVEVRRRVLGQHLTGRAARRHAWPCRAGGCPSRLAARCFPSPPADLLPLSGPVDRSAPVAPAGPVGPGRSCGPARVGQRHRRHHAVLESATHDELARVRPGALRLLASDQLVHVRHARPSP